MFAWIRLTNELWWPGCSLDPESDVVTCSFVQLPHLRIFKLYNRGLIPVDISQENAYNEWTGSNITDLGDFLHLHRKQEIPEDLRSDFDKAVTDLTAQLTAMVVAVDNTSEILTITTKRENAIPWDDYFMAVAFLSAMRSKDPSTQVGACIVDPRNRIVGIGYNGFPTGCSDDILPWARTAEDELDTKYPYVVHAEVNAILNKISAELTGCSIYVGLFPCNECAKTIIQSGIKKVVYLSDKYAHTNSMKASRAMFGMAGVTLRQYSPLSTSVIVNFNSIKK